jgi:NAD(P)-dependent dehydrogenase (short-subunit alcohol dehydrogenase family)
MSAEHTPRCAVVVGASRGIGLAISRYLLNHPGQPVVYATQRGPAPATGLAALAAEFGGRLQLLQCDTRNDGDLCALAEQLGDQGVQPDVVMHCAGILHDQDLAPEKSLAQLQRENLQRVFDVNAFGPLLLAQAMLGLLPRKAPAHFAALSAMVGSISDNRLGGWYAYRASKAALNQLLKTFAIEASRRYPQLCVTSIHPGTTDTDLSRPFQGNVPPGRLYSPEQSAARIMQVVLAGQPADSGRFMNWDGQTIPY